jgi:hypothetical protein
MNYHVVKLVVLFWKAKSLRICRRCDIISGYLFQSSTQRSQQSSPSDKLFPFLQQLASTTNLTYDTILMNDTPANSCMQLREAYPECLLVELGVELNGCH